MTDVVAPADAPWKERFTRLLERLPEGQEIELERLVVRVDPPSPRAMADEIVRRAAQGSLHAVYRVFSPETRIPLRDYPYDTVVPRVIEIEDDTTGETVRVDMNRNVELIVSGAHRDDHR